MILSTLLFTYRIGLVQRMHVSETVEPGNSRLEMLHRWLRSISTPIYLAQSAMEGVQDTWRLLIKGDDGQYFDVFTAFRTFPINILSVEELC